jgi:hypothetical protein
MTPTDILEKLLATNRTAARIILAGLGLIAATALAVSWIGDNPQAILLAAYILFFAFLVSMVTFIVTNRRIRNALGWVMTAGFTLFMVGLIDSALGMSGRLPMPACYVRIFWEAPKACEMRLMDPAVIVREEAATPEAEPDSADADSDESPEVREVVPSPAAPELREITLPPTTLASDESEVLLDGAQNTSDVEVAATDEEPPAIDPDEPERSGSVWLQFGPAEDRERMADLIDYLSETGWSIANGEEGGSAYDHAPDRNEVRFFTPDRRAAAEILAEDLVGFGGIGEVAVIDLGESGLIAPEGQIEIWLKR